jgi:hypothetical protein
VQNLSQLKAVYGPDDAEAMRLQAELLQVLGCRSVELAEYIEKRAGASITACRGMFRIRVNMRCTAYLRICQLQEYVK